MGMAEVISETEQGGKTTLTPPGVASVVVSLGHKERIWRAVQDELAITTSTLDPQVRYINANICQYCFLTFILIEAFSEGRESSMSVEMVG